MNNLFLITENAPSFFIRQLELLGFSVDYRPEISRNEIEETIGNYTGILIRSRISVDQLLIKKATNLNYILRPGSGLDIIDTKAAVKKNIEIINSPEGNRNAVAEHAIGLLLGLLNNIPRSFNDISKFKFSRREHIGEELSGKTVGIIGFGNTGSAFASKLQSFDVRILAYDKYKSGFETNSISETGMDTIFENADIVSFHIPLTDETHYMIDDNFLNQFRKKIILMNTSRGKILDIKSLTKAIHNNKVSGAVLDVLENENFNTLTADEKENIEKLLETKKVIITPHIAGLTLQSEEKIFQVLIEKLSKKIEL